MSLPLKIKVEKAITGYLSEVFETEADLSIYEGHAKNPDKPDFPWLIVYGEESQPFGDMPPATGIRAVTLRLSFHVDSEDDDEREDLNKWREMAECAMADLTAILAFTNPPAEHPDPRDVSDLFVYDVNPGGEPDEMENTDWTDQMIFEVVCQPADPLTGIDPPEPDPEP